MGRVYDFFSIKYLIPFDTVTKAIKTDSILRSIKTVKFENNIPAVSNIGGNAPAPFMVEPGQPDPKLTFEVSEIRAGMYSTFEDCTVTQTAAESSGAIGTFANTSGTSIKNGTNGISAIAVSTVNYANLKPGRYIITRGADATHVNIYLAGLTGSFTDQSGLVASAVSCVSGTVEVAALGITLTVVGTPVFAVGDVATVEEVRPPHYGYNKIVVGSGDDPSIIGLYGVQPKQVTGDIYLFEFPKLFIPGGLKLEATNRQFSTTVINAVPLVNPADDSVYTIYQILGQ